MDEKYLKVKELLKKYNQEQLLLNYDKFNNEEKEYLLDQILSIDFELINKLFSSINTINNKEEKNKIKNNEINKEKEIIEPISYIDKNKLNNEEKKYYEEIGIKEIKAGKLAAVTMAGGQGTRLGHDGPKGTFMLDINPKKSLFEILCESLKEKNEKYGVNIPWYIMTSKENNKQTVDFFEKNKYFNYPKGYIKFFIQGELPMLNQEGKVILDENGFVKLAADGHGGIFEAMFKNDVVEDMKNKNVEWIFIGPIDNPLVKMIDEIFIGIAKDKNALAIGKSLVKANPNEKVGVFCKKQGKPSVIEYTEISEELANKKDENGNLVFAESHINCNMFNIKAIELIGNNKLPYHSAFKKAKYLDENGKLIIPEEPNCYKFESFIFDSFNKMDNMEILRVNREEEFAPVKNKTGVDSAESAKELYIKFHSKNN